jgi:hypothetical protein
MVRRYENSDELILSSFPFANLILGIFLLFLIAIFLIWLIVSFFTNPNSLFEVQEKTWIEMIPVSCFAFAILLMVCFEINLWSMICTPFTTLKVNLETKYIDIVFKRFYGKKVNRFYFSQISKFKSYKKKHFFSTKYFLTLVLANNQDIKLEIPTGNLKNTVKLLKEINRIIKNRKYESSL